MTVPGRGCGSEVVECRHCTQGAVPGESEADGGSGTKGVRLGAPDLDSVSLWNPLEVAMQQCNELVAM